MFNRGETSDETKNEGIFLSQVKMEYFFRKITYRIDGGKYKELVSLAYETEVVMDNEVSSGCEFVETDSRELEPTNLADTYVDPLKEEPIRETHYLSAKQFRILKERYKDDLFSVTKEVIESLK